MSTPLIHPTNGFCNGQGHFKGCYSCGNRDKSLTHPSVHIDESCDEADLRVNPKFNQYDGQLSHESRVHDSSPVGYSISPITGNLHNLDHGNKKKPSNPYFHESELVDSGTANLPTVTNSEGGSQSDTVGRFDLIPGDALISLAGVLGPGAEKYGEDNWHKIPLKDHINHALEHLAFYQKGDTSEPHLDHALCRLAMAIWARENRKDN